MITGNEITQGPDSQSKKAKVDSSIDETKLNLKLTPPLYANKQEYVGITNEKTHGAQTRESDDSPSDTDGCARNLDDEHKYEEYDDYIDPPSKKMIQLNQNYKKKSEIGYYPNFFHSK